MLTAQHVERLLEVLCVKLGFCLPPVEDARLMRAPPEDVVAFTDAVFRAEGIEPSTADRHIYRQVRDVVSAAFWEARVEAESSTE